MNRSMAAHSYIFELLRAERELYILPNAGHCCCRADLAVCANEAEKSVVGFYFVLLHSVNETGLGDNRS